MIVLSGCRSWLLAALVLSCAARADAVQGRGGQGRGQRGGQEEAIVITMDEARERILDPDETDRGGLFSALVRAVNGVWDEEGLPSFFEDPERLYEPFAQEFRARHYGMLMEDQVGREFLRSQASRVSRGFGFNGVTASMILADHPSPEDLEALLEGYVGLQPRSFSRVGRARQVGRAIRSLKERDLGSDVIETAEAALTEHLDLPEANARAAALEGLFRAGHEEDVCAYLRDRLNDPSDSDAFAVLAACRRIINKEGFDPTLRHDAADIAVKRAHESESMSSRQAALLGASAPGAATFRDAVLMLADLEPEKHLDFLLSCYEEAARVKLMGIDGLQNLRTRLQRFRRQDDDLAREVDVFFYAQISDVGQRLFDLEEEPLQWDEASAFLTSRDVRYNALSYFESLWRDAEGVRDVFEDDPDSGECLAQLVRAGRDDRVGSGQDRLYYSIADKDENRVLAAGLLQRCISDLGLESPDVDLYRFYLEVVAQEISYDPARIDADLEALAPYSKQGTYLALPIVNPPGDAWVKNNALQGLVRLGYTVKEGLGAVMVSRPD